MTVLVGCSGWSYDDWVGSFYPLDLARKKGEWLLYYLKYFATVEINSTFYRVPGDLQLRSWINKAKKRPHFEYSLKIPKAITHEAMVNRDHDRLSDLVSRFERTCITPLLQAEQLGSVLFQLSPYFRFDESSKRTLEHVLDTISYSRFDVAVEFRHSSWLDDEKKEIKDDVMKILSNRNIANVILDGPGLPITGDATADHVYVRFHGRNRDIWFGQDKKDDYRLNRYDYLYTKDQLEPWTKRIQDFERKVDKVRVYFNNHARAKAAKNAFQLMDDLNIKHLKKEVRLQNQHTLGEF